MTSSMQRILVTGNAGAGKTTVARKIARDLDFPLIGLDKIVWQPGWMKSTRDAIAEKLTPLLEQESWVIDGVSSQAFLAADTIVFLDFSRSLCLRRALLRSLLHLFRQREDVPENCPEYAIFWRLVKIIWGFPQTTRPIIVANLKQSTAKKQVIWIHSSRELDQFLRKLKTVMPGQGSIGRL